MRMYVVRLNPDLRDCSPYSKYPTKKEYKKIHGASPMDGFHEAVNFLSERGIVRGYLPPRHLSAMRTGERFLLITITAKTAKDGGDQIIGIQAGCIYEGETKRRGTVHALGLTWHYRCPASFSVLFSESISGARDLILGGTEHWGRGPTFEIKTGDQERVIKALLKRLRDRELKKRVRLLIKRANEAQPTIELEPESTLETEVSKALRSNIDNVKGNKNPSQREVRTYQYERDPKVVAYTLKNAKGICFDCKKPGPFISKVTGLPYLEVHHIKTLKDGGSDTVDNAIALCPNCHRARHYS